MKAGEFGIFFIVVFLFVAILSAFTHKPPEDYANAVIPEKIIMEAGALVRLPGDSENISSSSDNQADERDVFLKTTNPVEFCRKKDSMEKTINIWTCRKYLWN